MPKTIVIKLTKSGPSAGPFTLTTEWGDVIAAGVSRRTLLQGVSYTVNSNVKVITITSTGKCPLSKSFPLESYTQQEFADSVFTRAVTGCIWRHLTDAQTYNIFYGVIHDYIIEYPFAYQYQDEILQNVKDYTKAYEYLPSTNGVFNDNARIEVDSKWFTHSILYNGQQSSGVLELVPKPKNNLQSYNQYPKFNADSKTITYTKSDNFYLFNSFWALNKSSQIPLFYASCESLSIDKVINQSNMDYSQRSFKKAPLRAKELKVRMILSNNCTTHLVSQFILGVTQTSYK